MDLLGEFAVIFQPKRRMLKIINRKCRIVLAVCPARPAIFALVIIATRYFFIKAGKAYADKIL